MQVKGWDITDLPERYSAADYDAPRRALAACAERSPDVAVLMQAGGVAYPGISDIDFLTLFKDDAREYYLAHSESPSKEERYLMKHDALLLGERFYRDYYYLDPLLRFVESGQPIVFKRKDLAKDPLDVSREEQVMLDIHFCFELLQMRLVDVRHKQYKTLPARHALISLKSIEYLLRVVAAHSMDTKARLAGYKGGYGTRLDALNRAWFDKPEVEAAAELIDLYEEGLELAYVIAFVFDDYLATIAGTKSRSEYGAKSINNAPKGVYFSSYGISFIFSPEVTTPKEALEQTIRLSSEHTVRLGYRQKLLRLPVVVMPLNLSLMILTFAEGKGILSEAMRRSTRSNIDTLPHMSSPALEKRVSLINEITDDFRAKQSLRGQGKGYLFGNNIFQYGFGGEKLRRSLAAWYLRRIFNKKAKTWR